jgi:hypothetical protein
VPNALGRLRQPGKLQSWGYINVQAFTAAR